MRLDAPSFFYFTLSDAWRFYTVVTSQARLLANMLTMKIMAKTLGSDNSDENWNSIRKYYSIPNLYFTVHVLKVISKVIKKI